MKTPFQLLILTLGGLSIAAPRSSTNYSISAEIADGGGAAAASANYAMQGSFHSMIGESNSQAGVAPGNYAVLHGFLSQLGDDEPPVEFVEWQEEQFPDPDAPEAQPQADPDHDGLDNIAEFAFGLDPQEPGLPEFDAANAEPGLPAFNPDAGGGGAGGAVALDLVMRTDGSVDYHIEASQELQHWDEADLVPVGPAEPFSPGWERVCYTQPAGATPTREFYRVTVTLN